MIVAWFMTNCSSLTCTCKKKLSIDLYGELGLGIMIYVWRGGGGGGGGGGDVCHPCSYMKIISYNGISIVLV